MDERYFVRVCVKPAIRQALRLLALEEQTTWDEQFEEMALLLLAARGRQCPEIPALPQK